jgi:hypothetical protein
VAAAGAVGTLAGGPVAGALAGGVLALAGPAQALRIAIKARPRVSSWRVAMAHGGLTMLAKWGNLLGQGLYTRDRLTGRHARLIEYKGAGLKSFQPTPSS